MWLFTPRGYFSVAQKPHEIKDDLLEVRARVRKHLENLPVIDGYPKPVIKATPEADYDYRCVIPRAQWGAMLAVMCAEIKGAKFKDEVTRALGHDTYPVLLNVWRVLLDWAKDDNPWVKGGWRARLTEVGVVRPKRVKPAKRSTTAVAFRDPVPDPDVCSWCGYGPCVCVDPTKI